MFSPTIKDKEAEAEVVERSFRMTLDFKVLISEITRERVNKTYQWAESDEDFVRDNALKQNRLLLALLNNEEILNKFLTYVITDKVCPHSESELGTVFQVQSEEQMLEPIYSSMDEEDAQFFQEVIREGHFWENTELVENSFVVEWTGASLNEVRLVGTGDVEAVKEDLEEFIRKAARLRSSPDGSDEKGNSQLPFS